MEDKLPGLVNVYSLRTWSHDRRKFVDLASYKMVIFHSFLYLCLSEGKYTLSFFWVWIGAMDRLWVWGIYRGVRFMFVGLWTY